MYFIRNNLLLKLIITLKLFVYTSSLIFPKASDAPQKSIICVVEKGMTNIQKLPLECSCIASYTSNQDTSPSDIQALRKDGDLQYLLIIDDYEYHTIRKRILSDDSFTEFVNEICDKIKKFSANGVLFNRMNSNYQEDGNYGDPNGKFEQAVQKLFAELRKRHDGLVIGLGLTSVSSFLDHAFTQKFMGSSVDFFVANTVLYWQCVHENHQADMANIDPLKDIKDTLDMIHSKGFIYDQLIFVIRVVVRSTTHNNANSRDDTSYSDMCCADHNFSKDRKFCVETLPNFYQKGLLVHTLNMKAVIVQSVDYDDFAANCGPEKFPVMQAIKAGVDGCAEPKQVTGEPNWATLARDRKN